MHRRRESDYPDESADYDHEPDYEAIFNDRREQKQRDMEYDPTLNP
jgi:hypothetical protein